MGRRKNDSYGEIHAKLVEAMQQACTSDESGTYPYLEKDMSFLHDVKKQEHKKHVHISRFGKVAAILIIVLLGMNVVLLATESNVSYGDKGILHRIYEGARGIFTDSEESHIVEFDETGDTYVISSFSEIEKAKRFWPDLYVPTELPPEYFFINLKISKDISGGYRAEYSYKYDYCTISLVIMSTDKNCKYISNSEGELYTYKDSKINIYWDDINLLYVADIYKNDIYMCVCGDLNKQELYDFIENIL